LNRRESVQLGSIPTISDSSNVSFTDASTIYPQTQQVFDNYSKLSHDYLQPDPTHTRHHHRSICNKSLKPQVWSRSLHELNPVLQERHVNQDSLVDDENTASTPTPNLHPRHGNGSESKPALQELWNASAGFIDEKKSLQIQSMMRIHSYDSRIASNQSKSPCLLSSTFHSDNVQLARFPEYVMREIRAVNMQRAVKSAYENNHPISMKLFQLSSSIIDKFTNNQPVINDTLNATPEVSANDLSRVVEATSNVHHNDVTHATIQPCVEHSTTDATDAGNRSKQDMLMMRLHLHVSNDTQHSYPLHWWV
jgi:hypothetical protein